MGWILDRLSELVESMPFLISEKRGGFDYLKAELGIEGDWAFFRPVLARQNSNDRLYFAINEEFLNTCLKPGSKIRSKPDYRHASEALPREGNGIAYASPRFMRVMQNLMIAAQADSPEPTQTIIEQFLIDFRRGTANVLVNHSDGIYWAGNSPFSFKAILNPFVTSPALVAAMAVPALEQAGPESQEEKIRNNLKEIAAAAQQYMIDTGAEEVTLDQIVGPGKISKDASGQAPRHFQHNPSSNCPLCNCL